MSDLHPFATTITTANLVNAAAIHQVASQRQLLRLQTAAQILSGLVVDGGGGLNYTNDPDTCGSREEVVNTALKYADLLLKKVTEIAD